MTFFSPIADAGLALVFILGSISVGYAGARWIYPPVKSWKGWKRVLLGSGIGIIWSILVVSTFSGTTQTFPIAAFAEFFAFMGMGLILIMGISALAARVAHGVLVHGLSVSSAVVRTLPKNNQPTQPMPQREFAANTPSMIKPAALRAPPDSKTLPRSVMEEPVLENDVMGMLRDEEEAKSPPEKSQSAPTPSAPMSELGDFVGFEDTLAQLKRDLKDFNDSMNKEHNR